MNLRVNFLKLSAILRLHGVDRGDNHRSHVNEEPVEHSRKLLKDATDNSADIGLWQK